MRALVAIALVLAIGTAHAMQPAVFVRLEVDKGVLICIYRTAGGQLVRQFGNPETFSCAPSIWVP